MLAVRIVAWTAQRLGVSLPPDLEPVLIVLLLGVRTDYSVFFLDGMRSRPAEGVPRVRAARLATAEVSRREGPAALLRRGNPAARSAPLAAARRTWARLAGARLAAAQFAAARPMALLIAAAPRVAVDRQPTDSGQLSRA